MALGPGISFLFLDWSGIQRPEQWCMKHVFVGGVGQTLSNDCIGVYLIKKEVDLMFKYVYVIYARIFI